MATTLVTEEAWNAELETKHQQVVEWLRSENLDGVLLKRMRISHGSRRRCGGARAHSQ
jgi:hypothetical protein